MLERWDWVEFFWWADADVASWKEKTDDGDDDRAEMRVVALSDCMRSLKMESEAAKRMR